MHMAVEQEPMCEQDSDQNSDSNRKARPKKPVSKKDKTLNVRPRNLAYPLNSRNRQMTLATTSSFLSSGT
jgi:hypothetical protein